MSCRECVHLHIVNGRIVYARCLLGRAVFEKYGEGRLDVTAHTCPEECSAAEVYADSRKQQTFGKMKGEGSERG